MSSDYEQPLGGGNVSAAVVRIGDTVRRPTGPWTPAVHALLQHLGDVGFPGAPRVLGIDEQDREILEYIPGVVPWGPTHCEHLGSDDAIRMAGRLLREFHEAVATFEPPAGAVWREPDRADDAVRFIDDRGLIVCHNDPTAWNLVVGDRWAFIDWDFAGPRPLIWDVAYALIGFLPIARDPTGLGWRTSVPFEARLRAFANGYELGPTDRSRVVEVVIARISSSYEHLRRSAADGLEPWTTLWNEGHGDGWADMHSFASEQREAWERALG